METYDNKPINNMYEWHILAKVIERITALIVIPTLITGIITIMLCIVHGPD